MATAGKKVLSIAEEFQGLAFGEPALAPVLMPSAPRTPDRDGADGKEVLTPKSNAKSNPQTIKIGGMAFYFALQNFTTLYRLLSADTGTPYLQNKEGVHSI